MNFCRYFLIFLLIINYTLFSQSIDSNFTLVIDPGHGGKDPGNTGNGYLEKKIALSIGLKIGERLKKRKNYNIILMNQFKKIQLPIEIKKKKSDFIIKNDFTMRTVKKYVKNILDNILNERSSIRYRNNRSFSERRP